MASNEFALDENWEKALGLMEQSFTSVVFDTWIKPLKPLYVNDDNVIMVRTNMDFFKDTIQQRYVHEITNCLKAVIDNPEDITVQIVSPLEKNTIKDSNKNAKLARQHNLKSKYIFETFVKGKCNELAFAAAVAVSEAPGLTTYNPLFLYGGVGLGKTHLMHSIGNYILEQTTDTKVLYVSSETFTNELIDSIKTRKNQEFRNKYRDIDVLLIDDIQFLSEKEGTQEEFFHTFNILYNANKQIVITSDQPPKKIETLEERLRSRFGCGLIVDVTSPDFETRTAILEKKAEIDHITIPKDVTKFIAKNIVSNIRDLEGAMNKVAAYAKLSKSEITMELTVESLKDVLQKAEKKVITVEYIQEVVANHYNISPEQIRSKKRTHNITYPRQIAMYLCRKIMDVSATDTGKMFGGRDHSTVIHGCDKITAEMERDANLRQVLIELEKKISE